MTCRISLGRYCWKQLPFDLGISQDISEARMNNFLEGLNSIVSTAVDVCIFGTDILDHD